jgi:predicted phage tail protein
MKSIFLHGAIGEAFGEKFKLDVSTPREALRALLAVNDGMKKYLIDKESKGIHYGIKKKDEFIQQGEEDFNLTSDFHIAPVPAGGATFALNLAMMAATTALSMIVNKKMAETMKQDNETLTMQTQSYIYNGKSNHMKQGQVIPFGYGRMLVGSSVVSSSVVNYEWDKEYGKILFIGGPFGLLPKNHPYSGVEKVPWLDFIKYRSETHMTEEEKNNNTLGISDPIYKVFKAAADNLKWGDGGEYLVVDHPGDGMSFMSRRKQGNTWTGYTFYIFKGPYKDGTGSFAVLPGYDANKAAYWGGTAPANQEKGYKMNQAEADLSICAVVQSVPILETAPTNEKEFYPILFETKERDWHEGSDVLFPVTVGERYKNGKKKPLETIKEDGLGWYAFESVSIQKNVDMICEGPIEGFCDNQGKTLEYKTGQSSNPQVTMQYQGATINMREENNDFLQAVRLNDIPVKEIKNGLDSFNFNEFDIDIGRDDLGEIGGYNQNLLEPQYRFVSSTKDTQGQLFGYRKTDLPPSVADYVIKEFKKNSPFQIADYVKDVENPSQDTWVVQRDLSTEWKDGVDYQRGSSLVSKIVYIKSGKVYQFYEVNGQYDLMIKDIKEELNAGRPLWEKDIFSEDGKFYEGTYDIDDIMYYTPNLSFRAGDLLVTHGSENLWEAKHDSDYMAKPGEVRTIEELAVPSELSIMQELKRRGIVADLSINPTSHPEFFDPININAPDSVTYVNQVGKKVTGIFMHAGNLNQARIDPKEEYHLTHSIINTEVTDVIVSLQIDELMYIYGGDDFEVKYKFGEMQSLIMGLLAGIGTYLALPDKVVGTATEGPASAITRGTAAGAITSAAVAGIVTAVGATATIDVGDKVENSGETWPNRTKFRIKYGNEGESLYSTDVHFYGVATSAYAKDIHISLPPNPFNKNRIIKVYRITHERNPIIEGETAARYKERTSLGAITEITNINLNYNSSVVIGSRVVAKEIPSIPKRNYNLKLKKVQVPINYDPKTRRYTDSWSGQFNPVLRWTDNPAWCLYDLITNKRYGVGKFGIKEEDVDKWTLYKMAKYCDEIVNTGYSPVYIKANFRKLSGRKIVIENMLESDSDAQFTREFQHPGKNLAIYYDGFNEVREIEAAGKDVSTGEYIVILDHEATLPDGQCATEIHYPLLEPRYTMNAMLTSQQDGFKLINEIASVFRAFAYWDAGAIHFFQDEPRESLMMFTNNNVEKTGFVYSNTPRTSRANSVKLKYLDKFNDFKPKVWHSQDKDKIDQNGFIEKTMDGFGISTPGQAHRAAEYIVQGGNMETELISFMTSMAGAYLKPGDVFEVMDTKRTVGRFGGKIIDIYVENGGQRAEVDIDFPINTIVNPEDKKTYKTLKLYTVEDSESIESLNEYTKDKDGDGTPDRVIRDEDINALRQRQIGEFDVVSVKNQNTTLTIIGKSQYEYIDGEFDWREAKEDANRRGGELATVLDQEELSFLKISMPEDSDAWIGGTYVEEPSPSMYTWDEPQGCDGNEIRFFNFPGMKGEVEEGQRVVLSGGQNIKVSVEPALTEEIRLVDGNGNQMVDSDGNNIFSQIGGEEIAGSLLFMNGSQEDPDLRDNYIYAKGSSDPTTIGDWYRGLWTEKRGYMLKKRPSTELLELNDIKGMTFILEDGVSFAEASSYKVLNVSEQSLGIFKIDGMEYDQNKFKLIEENESIPTPRQPVIFTESLVDAPGNVKLEFNDTDPWGNPRPRPIMRATWDGVLGAAGYRVQFFRGKELLTTVELSNKTFQHDYEDRDITEGENYHVRVYSITI